MSRSTATTPLIWFFIGLAFVGVVYPTFERGWFGAALEEPTTSPGLDASTMYVSAYLLEYVLSFDAVLVILWLCRTNRVPRWRWPRVLFWALIGTVFVRLILLSGTAWIARALPWSMYVFGLLVLYSGYAALRSNGHERDASEPWDEQRWVLNPVSRLARATKGDHDGALGVTRNGRRFLTAAGVCAFAIIVNEVWFAIDSVALLSVSKTTFIVVTATVLATIAQRSWLYVIRLETLRPPRRAAGALLTLVGLKMLAHEHLHVPHAVWLAVITGLACMGIVETFGSRECVQPKVRESGAREP